MDVGMSLWLPGGELGEYRFGQGAARDGRHGPRRRRRALRDARGAPVVAAHHGRRGPGASVRRRAAAEAEAHPVQVALDVRFDAITPAVGTDGQPERAQVGRGGGGRRHGRQGAPRAGGSLDGHAHRRRRAPRVARRARQPRPVLGPAALGRPQDVALVLHQRRRRPALRGHPARHRRRRPPPRLGLGRRRGPPRWPSGACAPSSRTTA